MRRVVLAVLIVLVSHSMALATWSVNATNIVTQKYFRGTLGTPEREN